MKILAGFELEGLVIQGDQTVWVPLGQFLTRDAAFSSVFRSRWGDQIRSVRVTAIFRDPTGGYPACGNRAADNSHPATNRPHFQFAKVGADSDSVTSA